MKKEKTLIEYSINDNTVRISKSVYLHYKPKFSFEFLNNNNQLKITSNSTHRTISGAMRKFNKAVKALKQGTNIR